MTEPILERGEALSAIWLLADILDEIREIKALLSDDDEEDEEQS